MRQVISIVAATLLAAAGAVVLGEYDLRGTTVLVGFPLYGVAVTEVALAVGKRLSRLGLAVVVAVVAGGLIWALWISFGHFRNGVHPPLLSWVMVGVAVVATLAWGRSGRSRSPRSRDRSPGGRGAHRSPSGRRPGRGAEDEQARR